MKTAFGLIGNVTLRTLDAKTGELIDTQERHNLVVAVGAGSLLRHLQPAYDSYTKFDHVKFNFSNMGPADWSDTDVVGGSIAKDVTDAPLSFGQTPEAGVGIICEFELLAAEYNGNTINELSLWTNTKDIAGIAPDELTLFSRVVIAPIAKTSAIRIEGTWEIRCSVVVA